MSKKLEAVGDTYTDVEVAEELKELPAETKQAVKRSYAEVLSMLTLLQPTEQTWEQKVRPRNSPSQG